MLEKERRWYKKQTIETLINEEALLFAKYLRDEGKHGFQELLNPLN